MQLSEGLADTGPTTSNSAVAELRTLEAVHVIKVAAALRPLETVSVSKMAATEEGCSVEGAEGRAGKPSPPKSRLSLKRNRKKDLSHSVVYQTRTPNPKRVKLDISEANASRLSSDDDDDGPHTRTKDDPITAGSCDATAAAADTSTDPAPQDTPTDPAPQDTPTDPVPQDTPSPATQESAEVISDCEHTTLAEKKEKKDDVPNDIATVCQPTDSEAHMLKPKPAGKSTEVKRFLWYAPSGMQPCDYSPVILQRLNSYISDLRAAQSKVLQRVSWGVPAKSSSMQPADRLERIRRLTRTSARRPGKRIQPACLLDLKSGRVVAADDVERSFHRGSDEMGGRRRREQRTRVSSSPDFEDFIGGRSEVTPSRKLTQQSLSKPALFIPRLKRPRERKSLSSEDSDTPPLLSDHHITADSTTQPPEESTPRPEAKFLTRRRQIRNTVTTPKPAAASKTHDDDDSAKKEPKSPEGSSLDGSNSGPAVLLAAMEVLEEGEVNRVHRKKGRGLLPSDDGGIDVER